MREAVIIGLNAVIKATTDSSGDRLIECEVSNEVPDLEGDVIEQKALLDSSESFIKNGHIDIDHYSELGARIGVNPEEYIIGKPTKVTDLGDKRTGIVGRIMRAKDGKFDPQANRYDAFWKSLQSDPPVTWRASIYGIPIGDDAVIDCNKTSCSSGATRYHIKSLDWRSLAMTRNPINNAIKGKVKIVSAKSYAMEIIKSIGKDAGYGMGILNSIPAGLPMSAMPEVQVWPRSMDELHGQYTRHISKDCAFTKGMNSAAGFRDHFMFCCGMPIWEAELMGKALMYECIQQKKRD